MHAATRKGVHRLVAGLIERIVRDPLAFHSLHELGEEAGLSPDHLNRCFELTTGETLFRHIARIRIERSAYALSQGDSVADASYLAGFEANEAFSRAFKRQFGCPPKEFASRALDWRISSHSGVHWEPDPSLCLRVAGIESEQVRLKRGKQRAIRVRRHVGDFAGIPQAWDELGQELENGTQDLTQWITYYESDGLRTSSRSSMVAYLGYLAQDSPEIPGFPILINIPDEIYAVCPQIEGSRSHGHEWTQMNRTWIPKSAKRSSQPAFDIYDEIPANWGSLRATAYLALS